MLKIQNYLFCFHRLHVSDFKNIEKLKNLNSLLLRKIKIFWMKAVRLSLQKLMICF